MSEKQIYEIGYLVIPNVSEEEVLTEVANIKAILEKKEATFLSGDEPKFINLSYSISKMFGAEKQVFEKAYFAWMKFEVEISNLVKIKEELDKYQNILRYLLIKTLKKDTLVSENKKIFLAKKEIEIVDEEKEKKVKPVKIVEKVDVPEKKEEEVVEDKKIKEDLDEIIDNLIIK